MYPRVCFWNINGRIHLLRSAFIVNWLVTNFDIVFISETHLTKGQKFEIKDFSAVHNPYSSVDDLKARGGVSCFIKITHMKHIAYVDTSVSENVIVRFKNGDVIFGSYLPPSDSPYHNITDIGNIANMFVPKDHNRIVCGGGDLNSRVGDVKLRSQSQDLEYLPNVDKVVNDNGKELTKVCQSFHGFIVNNLKFKEKSFHGAFTFKKGDRKSQNDLILGNMVAIEALQEFRIHDILWNPSDHTPISVTLKLCMSNADYTKTASADLLTERFNDQVSKPKKIIASDVNWDGFQTLVESDSHSYQDKVQSWSKYIAQPS